MQRQKQNQTQQSQSPHPEQIIAKRQKKLDDRDEIEYLIRRLILVSGLVCIMLFAIFGVVPMKNDDMKPRISAGDVVLYFRWDKDFVARDVAVYRADGKTRVGRIVARPGDTVVVSEDSRLMVNDYYSYEEDIFYTTPAYDEQVSYPLTLAEDEYFILADYREGARDSRWFGPVKLDQIRGKVIGVIRWMNL